MSSNPVSPNHKNNKNVSIEIRGEMNEMVTKNFEKVEKLAVFS
jgi:hypothetical protein